MSMRLMIVSAVATAALSAPAVAQQGGDTQVNPPNPAAPAQMQMAPAPAAPAPTQAPAQPSDQSSAQAPDQAPDQATTGAAGSMVAPASAEPARREPAATSQAVVSSDPIPDTRANRAKYGAPLSSAGRRSVPSGN